MGREGLSLPHDTSVQAFEERNPNSKILGAVADNAPPTNPTTTIPRRISDVLGDELLPNLDLDTNDMQYDDEEGEWLPIASDNEAETEANAGIITND